jgi:hypothetical protein
MFNLNDVVGKQSRPRSTYKRNDNHYMCRALSETSLPLEIIDTISRIMIQPQLHNWGQIPFFCNYKDYKVALCVCGASTPSFHFW